MNHFRNVGKMVLIVFPTPGRRSVNYPEFPLTGIEFYKKFELLTDCQPGLETRNN
jgi:hypothetical protein